VSGRSARAALLPWQAVAKKSRTPPPPRPVQAPQRRTEKGQPVPGGGGRNRWLMLFAVSGVVALAVVIGVFVLTGRGSGKSNDSSIASTMRAAGCTYEDPNGPKPPAGQAQHIQKLSDTVDWNTYPPAGGQHYPAWAVWGFYTDPVNPKRVVHNEEHGAVVLWWGPQTPSSQVDKLQTFYSSSPNSMFGTPVGTIDGKSLGSKVAITAWTGDPTTYQQSDWGQEHVAVCPQFDQQAFTAFRDAFRGKGPEGIPTSANNPGEGPG
jgi:hypothetical protein